MTHQQTLKIVYSYIQSQINPNIKAINLDDIKHLHPEDLIDYEIPKELFQPIKYSEDDLKSILKDLNRVIIAMEKRNIDNIK